MMLTTLRVLGGSAVVLVVAACMMPQPVDRPDLCEPSRNVPCLTEAVCDYDAKNACQLCRCSTPTTPDDRLRPPDTVASSRILKPGGRPPPMEEGVTVPSSRR